MATPARTPKTNPVAAEANGTLTPVSFKGDEYLVPPTTLWPITALADFEDGRVVGFLRGILGPDQAKTLLSSGANVGELGEFVVSIQEALGIEGN